METNMEVSRVHSKLVSARETSNARGFLDRMTAWYRLKKLEYEVRSSERFQRYCESIRCYHVAELEKKDRAQTQERVAALKISMRRE